MLALYIVLGGVVASVVAWLVLRKTVRTRLKMERTIRQDPDIQ